MRNLEQIDEYLEGIKGSRLPPDDLAQDLILAAEEILENWLVLRSFEPTNEIYEGFRLLALQKQGANKNPSFNACRETCREAAYHFNIISQATEFTQKNLHIAPLRRIVLQLLYFIILETEQMKKSSIFCCSSKSLYIN